MCIFNSRDLAYKNPFGAVPCHTQIMFKIKLPNQYDGSRVNLVVYADQYLDSVSLTKGLNTEDNMIEFIGHYMPQKEDVYFYYFEIETNGQKQYIKKNEAGCGFIADYGPDFQLTVYSPQYQTPEWIKGGVIYQIFPDRFCDSGKKHENVPTDRILRSDWGGTPYFLPNEQGEILNNDFFCGDLEGIISKLPYLQSLGVTLIYLNPIFEAHSSHRYDTADYRKIDPLLGTEEDFRKLCAQAKSYGIRIILDGVFSHTGSDSVYFNQKNRYPTEGAYNSQHSPYYDWYDFSNYPDEYRSWWGFKTLPEVNENHPSYINFICGQDGVIKKWLHAGASGFRLDVADELPDSFIEKIRQTIKEENSEYLLLGEVWEDASNKMAYGVHRRYFLGKELDTVMNYPFKDAILWLFLSQDKNCFIHRIMDIVENYPAPALHVAMNSLSTHDTERAVNILAGESAEGKDRIWQSHHNLTKQQYALGKMRLKAAMVLQFFLPGVPCIYYGDEAGLQGYKDPFNRLCYPWGHEDKDLLTHTEHLAKLRRQAPAMKNGMLKFIETEEGILAFTRTEKNEQTWIFVNYTAETKCYKKDLSHLQLLYGSYQHEQITLPPYGFAVFCLK